MQHIARRAGREDLLGADDPTAHDEVAVWLSFFTGDFHLYETIISDPGVVAAMKHQGIEP